MSKELILTPDELCPAYKKAIPASPRYFHFMTSINPLAFHEADVVIFRQTGKPDVIIKDRYGKFQKK